METPRLALVNHLPLSSYRADMRTMNPGSHAEPRQPTFFNAISSFRIEHTFRERGEKIENSRSSLAHIAGDLLKLGIPRSQLTRKVVRKRVHSMLPDQPNTQQLM